MTGVPEKDIFWSVALYIKKLSFQYNWLAEIEQVQEKNVSLCQYQAAQMFKKKSNNGFKRSHVINLNLSWQILSPSF